MKVKKGTSKGKKSGKTKSKKVKVKVAKKKRDTGGFPELVALTKETDGDSTYFAVHPIDFSTINEATAVGVFKLRRVSNIEVVRKIRRPKKD